MKVDVRVPAAAYFAFVSLSQHKASLPVNHSRDVDVSGESDPTDWFILEAPECFSGQTGLNLKRTIRPQVRGSFVAERVVTLVACSQPAGRSLEIQKRPPVKKKKKKKTTELFVIAQRTGASSPSDRWQTRRFARRDQEAATRAGHCDINRLLVPSARCSTCAGNVERRMFTKTLCCRGGPLEFKRGRPVAAARFPSRRRRRDREPVQMGFNMFTAPGAPRGRFSAAGCVSMTLLPLPKTRKDAAALRVKTNDALIYLKRKK